MLNRYVTEQAAIANNNVAGYFKGSTSGFQAINISYIDEGGSCRISWTGNVSQPGDSGGPIYTRTGTDATLYGIVSQTFGQVSYGVYADNIFYAADIEGVSMTFYPD